MLEGLEAVEVNLIKTIENKDFRIDSDFWTKEPRQNPKLKYSRIGEILKSAQYGISVSMNEDKIGYPIYRMNEIHNMMCDLDVDKNADISKEDFEKFKLNDKDVLFNRTNSYEWVGRTGIYRKFDEQDFTFASYLVRFIPNVNIINPEYLTTFLNTKYGIWDVKRRSRHSINQTNVNPEEVKEIFIPLLNNDIQNLIKDNFEKANLCRLKSQELYNQAKSLLLETIGLKNFKPSTDPINIKSFKDSFITTGRLDSEFYQKKYEDYEKSIRSNSLGYTLVSNEYTLVKKVSEKEKPFYNYIEIGDINISDGTASYNLIETSDLPANAKTEVKKGDILISKVRSNRGAVAIIDFDVENLIVSGAFTVLREKKSSVFSNETLKVLLRTTVYKDWLLKFNIGTQYPVIRDEDILNIPIPKIPKDIQESITNKIRQAQELKKQSEHLLDTAKRSVEIAIEQNESEAINYINKNIYYEKEN